MQSKLFNANGAPASRFLRPCVRLCHQTPTNSHGTVHAQGRGMEQRDPITEQIIACAIEVHRHLGAGLLEKAYALAMRVELAANGIGFEYERPVPLTYKACWLGSIGPI